MLFHRIVSEPVGKMGMQDDYEAAEVFHRIKLLVSLKNERAQDVLFLDKRFLKYPLPDQGEGKRAERARVRAGQLTLRISELSAPDGQFIADALSPR